MNVRIQCRDHQTLLLADLRVRAVPDVRGGVLRLHLHDPGGDGREIHSGLQTPPVQDHINGDYPNIFCMAMLN